MFDPVRNPTLQACFPHPIPTSGFLAGRRRRLGEAGSTLETARALYFKLQLHQTQTRFCHRASSLGLLATPLAFGTGFP